MKITKLIDLANKVIKMFDNHVSENDIHPPMRTYVYEFITELHVSEAGCTTQGGSKIIKKPDWTMIVVDFIQEKITKMPEFANLARAITKEYKNSIDNITQYGWGRLTVTQPEWFLLNFIERLIYKKLEGVLSEELIIEYASLFKSDIKSCHSHASGNPGF
jgi:hypothetical protein